VSAPDFIEVYPDALGRDLCAALVRRFDESGAAEPGQVGGGVMPELKDSADIHLAGRPEWKDAVDALNVASMRALVRYVRTYRYALVAPLMLNIVDPDTGKPKRLAAEDFDRLDDARLGAILALVFRPGAINLQRYTAGKGGYPYWHCEHYPKGTDAEALHRVLLWTVYLNDGFTDGETEFLYQERKIVPRAGSLLVAPAAFTHTHRGNRPAGGDKYIATSWVLFQRGETLFGPRG
jgi:hypothetical protein